MSDESAMKVFICEEGGSTPLIDKMFYMGISPNSSARMISHPVEDGSKIFDNKVIEPDRISVTGEVNYSDKETFSKLREMFKQKAFKFYDLRTFADYDGDEFRKLSLMRLSPRQSSDNPYAAEVRIEFQKVLLARSSSYTQTPQDPANASTKSG